MAAARLAMPARVSAGLPRVFTRLVGGAAVRLRRLLRIERVGALHHARHKDSRQIDQLGCNFANFNDLVDLNDGAASGFGKSRIQVLAATAKLHVTGAIGAMGAQQGVIEFDRRFEDIAPAVEFTHFLAFFQISASDGG